MQWTDKTSICTTTHNEARGILGPTGSVSCMATRFRLFSASLCTPISTILTARRFVLIPAFHLFCNSYHSNDFFKVLTRKILKYWSNFVRYSNPNGPSQDSSYSASSSSVELDEDMRSGLRRFNNLEEYVRLPNRATQTMIQPIEYWPKYRITFNPKEDSQRAHIVLNSNGVSIDHNLRSEYCAFWGSFIPSLILSECRKTA